MSKSLVLALIASFFTASLSQAQVGYPTLQKQRVDDYEGDPGTIVQTRTNIEAVLKAWEVSEYAPKGESIVGYVSKPNQSA